MEERKLRRIGAGVTASSIDGAGFEGYWLHRNLAGKAERIRFDGRISGIGTGSELSALDALLSAKLTLPGRFNPDTDVVANTAFT